MTRYHGAWRRVGSRRKSSENKDTGGMPQRPDARNSRCKIHCSVTGAPPPWTIIRFVRVLKSSGENHRERISLKFWPVRC